MKIIKYFIQAFVIYIFFVIIKILGLNISRKLFAKIFQIIGPLIKSEKTINVNLEKFLSSYNEEQKKNIKKKMWSNYGKVFVEYLFLNKLLKISKENNLKLLTTEKDFFRIKHFNLTEINYLTIILKIINEEMFEKELRKHLI